MSPDWAACRARLRDVSKTLRAVCWVSVRPPFAPVSGGLHLVELLLARLDLRHLGGLELLEVLLRLELLLLRGAELRLARMDPERQQSNTPGCSRRAEEDGKAATSEVPNLHNLTSAARQHDEKPDNLFLREARPDRNTFNKHESNFSSGARARGVSNDARRYRPTHDARKQTPETVAAQVVR